MTPVPKRMFKRPASTFSSCPSKSQRELWASFSYRIHRISSLPSYATAELFKSAAIIYKRGQKCKPDVILDLLTNLLQDPSETLQTLGLRLIEALCLEHAILWRTSVTISYRQHHQAKKRFEEDLLKKFMTLSLAYLTKFVQSGYVADHVIPFPFFFSYFDTKFLG